MDIVKNSKKIGCLCCVNPSILFSTMCVNCFAQVSGSILVEGAELRRYTKIRNAIIEDNSNIPQSLEMGYGLEEDGKRLYASPLGNVTVTKDAITNAEERRNKLLYYNYFSKLFLQK